MPTATTINPDRRPCVCPRATGEQLIALAYRTMGGDTLVGGRAAFSHKGSPAAVDTNGVVKGEVYDAVCRRDVGYFDRLAAAWNDRSLWRDLVVSRRGWKRETGKRRPLSIPSEAKRLYAQWVLLHLAERVADCEALEPTVVGFRRMAEFESFAGRRDGVRIQDVFATTVLMLLRQHGPWAVSLDLHDAYGNLPHRAIHAAMKDLGVNHHDRRRIVEMVRVRVQRLDGKIQKDKDYGIEQGNPLSNMTFNLVISHVFRELRGFGVAAASFGDDIVLVAATEAGALGAFDAFVGIAAGLGFKIGPSCIRPLGTTGKATRIYDTRVEQLPLIKTYLVDRTTIGLAPQKAVDLAMALPPSSSLSNVRSKNQWKVVSKSFLRTIPSGNFAATEQDASDGLRSEGLRTAESATAGFGLAPPSPLGEADGGARSYGTQDDQGSFEVDAPTTKAIDVPMALNGSYAGLSATTTVVSESAQGVALCATPEPLVSTAGIDHADPDLREMAGSPKSGREPVLRTQGGPDVGVTSGDNGGKGVGHAPFPPDTVLQVRSVDIDSLKAGRRLRVGHVYRGFAIDLRGLVGAVGVDRLQHAIGQLARVSSHLGLVRFLVHPGETWPFAPGTFSPLHPVGQVVDERGLILGFRRAPRRGPVQRNEAAGVAPSVPNVELVVRGMRQSRTSVLTWTATLQTAGGSEPTRVPTTTPNKTIARCELVAAVLASRNPLTIAVKVHGGLRDLLLNGAGASAQAAKGGATTWRVRHVGLSRACETVAAWQWKVVGPWLVGRRSGVSAHVDHGERTMLGRDRKASNAPNAKLNSPPDIHQAGPQPAPATGQAPAQCVTDRSKAVPTSATLVCTTSRATTNNAFQPTVAVDH